MGIISEQFPEEELTSEEPDYNDFSDSKVKEIVWRAGTTKLNPQAGGLWFGETKDGVEKFALSVRGEARAGKPYMINIKNPKFYDKGFWHHYLEDIGYDPKGREKLMNKLKDEGYDGIVINTDTWNDTGDENAVTSKQFIVFDEKQIKPI